MRPITRILKRFSHLRHTAARMAPGEHGQAIVLIGITGLVLLAFVGLAIDGGRLFFLKRDTQTAADAGGLAAARALCTLRDYEVAALEAVDANGFSNDRPQDSVEIFSPPVHAKTEIPLECQGCFVEVAVTSDIPPSFTQLVFDGPLQAMSYSIATCNPDTTYGLGQDGLRALWSGSDHCQNTVDFTGSSNYIYGGIHSNFDIHSGASGGGATVVGPVSYVESLDIPDGKVEWLTYDDVKENNQYTVSGACDISCFADLVDDDTVYPWENPYQVDEPTVDYPLDHNIADYRPAESSLADTDGAIAAEEKAAGTYYHYTECKNKNDSMDRQWLVDNNLLNGNTLATGVYYSECHIDLSGIDGVNGNVTFVAEGSIQFSNSTTDIDAHRDDLLAFTVDGGNACSSKSIKFSGSENDWTGNMFAPYGEIQMSASGNTTTHGCLVGYSINLSGSNQSIECETDSDSNKIPAVGFID